MPFASGIFGVFLVSVALLLQRWQRSQWEGAAEDPTSTELHIGFSRGQVRRRGWTNLLIGMIGCLMTVSAFVFPSTLWLLIWGLIGLLLITIVLMACLDIVLTWLQYRRKLRELARATGRDQGLQR